MSCTRIGRIDTAFDRALSWRRFHPVADHEHHRASRLPTLKNACIVEDDGCALCNPRFKLSLRDIGKFLPGRRVVFADALL